MNKEIQIRCKRPYCNKLFMIYHPSAYNNGLCLAGVELKCEKCKRVLRFKNYTDAVLEKHARDGVFYV